MANTYEQIHALANKNNMGLSNTINRDYGIPLDCSSVQGTYEDALAYAKTSTLAYIGQPISVGDTLYVVTDEAGGYLKAVGTIPTGDEASITVDNDGKISIFGFAAANSATLPRKTANGTVEWVAIDAIVSGDGNEKTRLAIDDKSAITITTNYDEANDTYIYTLGVDLPELPHVPEYTILKELADNKVTYRLFKDDLYVGDTITVPNAYDDTELDGRIAELETTNYVDDVVYDSNSKKVYLVSNGEQLGNGFDTSSFIKDGMIESVKLANDKLVITWNSDVDTNENGEKDVTEIDLAYLIDLYEAGNGIIITENAICVDTLKIATVSALNEVKATASMAQTAGQVSTAISNALADYTTTGALDIKLQPYAKTSDVTAELQFYVKSDSIGATLEPYAKTSAVESALQSYAKTADIASIYATAEALDNINLKAIDAQNRVGIVEGKISDITSVGGEPNVLERVKVNGVTQQVINREVNLAVPTKIADLSDGVGLQESVNQNTAVLSTLGTDLSNLSKTVTTNTTSINELISKDTELLEAIQENEEKFNNYSTTEQINAKISEEINSIDLSTYAKESEVKATTDQLANRISNIEGSLGVDGGSVYEQLEAIGTRLDTIEGIGKGSISNAVATANQYADQAELDAVEAAKVYTNDETAKDRARLTTLESAATIQDSLISSNSSAIAKEVLDRSAAVTSINEKLGNAFSKDFTIEAAIADAKLSGTTAIAAVNSLTTGAVAGNTTSINSLRTDLASEISTRENKDSELSHRLTEVETFFENAAKDSEGLNNALDKLVDIQNFLSGDGSTIDQILDAIDKNTTANSALTITVGNNDSGLVKAATDAKSAISAVEGRVTAVESIILGYTTEGEIKADIDATKVQANKGVTDAAAAQSVASVAQSEAATTKKAVDNLASVVEIVEQVLENTQTTANDAQEMAEENADEIANIKANYVSFSDNSLFAGDDVIIFDCGSATENILS